MKILYLLKILILLLIITSCDENVLRDSKNSETDNIVKTILSGGSGTYTGGSFYLQRSKSETPGIKDTNFTIGKSTIDWYNTINSYFGDETDVQMDYVKVNNNSLTEKGWAGTYFNYVDYDSPTIYFNGSDNILEWDTGSTVYYDTISANIPDIGITSHDFFDVHDNSNNLTITWNSSSNLNDEVFIMVSEWYNTTDTTSAPSSLDNINSGLISDNGSYVISSSDLSGFNEDYAMLTIARFEYKEVSHGGETYLIAIINKFTTTIKII